MISLTLALMLSQTPFARPQISHRCTTIELTMMSVLADKVQAWADEQGREGFELVTTTPLSTAWFGPKSASSIGVTYVLACAKRVVPRVDPLK